MVLVFCTPLKDQQIQQPNPGLQNEMTDLVEMMRLRQAEMCLGQLDSWVCLGVAKKSRAETLKIAGISNLTLEKTAMFLFSKH